MPPKGQTSKARPVGPRPATFDHLKKKQPLERTVTVVLSDEAARAYAEAAEALERARLTGKATPELEQATATARAALEAETVTLRFRSIGRKAYDALVRDCPPTDEDKAEAKEKGEPEPLYDVGTFAPALIAASCVEPTLTAEQVTELWDEWNTAEIMPCWMAALEVNTQRRVVDLGKGNG